MQQAKDQQTGSLVSLRSISVLAATLQRQRRCIHSADVHGRTHQQRRDRRANRLHQHTRVRPGPKLQLRPLHCIFTNCLCTFDCLQCVLLDSDQTRNKINDCMSTLHFQLPPAYRINYIPKPPLRSPQLYHPLSSKVSWHYNYNRLHKSDTTRDDSHFLFGDGCKQFLCFLYNTCLH